ncbi:hypothetical protein CDD82_5857 [Ophiocordyceps australis]|uniref:Phosphatidylinositol-specific phospholipase C X domain-containing protein n=1 Tax=Ophiocordyceps australis TaxID=1399860 RepID=A0A2C5YYS8_9HYPO|nr:hypothetical protein CDD82_5857 [Ophiocordyceps australis]
MALVWLLLLLLPTAVVSQSVTFSGGTSDLTFIQGSRTPSASPPTGPPTSAYSSYASKVTLTASTSDTTLTATTTWSGSATTGNNLTQTASTPEPPRNTQPCNNYLELCTRKYSNITNVAAHNSPFVRPGNSGSNQELPVKTQLDDGVRFLQAQIQWPVNGSVPHFCHTTCDLLDAGPINEWLTQVREWVDMHPFDVVTILLGNGNYSTPDLYVPYIERSGILKYAYEPPFFPMALADWPTLEDMILRGKRVVMFLDYMADENKYPWLLDQFSQMWETPFDPLDRNFPCVVQRPPDLAPEAARDRLYLMNHNLNVDFNIFDTQILVPAVALLNETNAADGTGSVGLAANNCRAEWGRAPNFLNVDYYNYGSPPGSVFEAAARVNNVTYNRPCCGKVSLAASVAYRSAWQPAMATAAVLAVLLMW